mmetsp:Transcript_10356/g.30825  ORF Transcript_10356/g.30825 Transcript_10356/m.30825 type:complete len:323 (-) Transcript_10356:71-1039(-)
MGIYRATHRLAPLCMAPRTCLGLIAHRSARDEQRHGRLLDAVKVLVVLVSIAVVDLRQLVLVDLEGLAANVRLADPVLAVERLARPVKVRLLHLKVDAAGGDGEPRRHARKAGDQREAAARQVALDVDVGPPIVGREAKLVRIVAQPRHVDQAVPLPLVRRLGPPAHRRVPAPAAKDLHARHPGLLVVDGPLERLQRAGAPLARVRLDGDAGETRELRHLDDRRGRACLRPALQEAHALQERRLRVRVVRQHPRAHVVKRADLLAAKVGEAAVGGGAGRVGGVRRQRRAGLGRRLLRREVGHGGLGHVGRARTSSQLLRRAH